MEILAVVVYVLVFIQFVNTDNLRFYQIATFPEMSQCQEEKKRASVMKNHSSQELLCLEITTQLP
tara:strand:- start:1023 stop:1217 length:195 start_codon:yes stop_codon:yes gene_type:complete